MNDFIIKHQDKILGTISCFDRLLFNGPLPISYPEGMEGFLNRRVILFKDSKNFASTSSDAWRCMPRRSRRNPVAPTFTWARRFARRNGPGKSRGRSRYRRAWCVCSRSFSILLLIYGLPAGSECRKSWRSTHRERGGFAANQRPAAPTRTVRARGYSVRWIARVSWFILSYFFILRVYK